MVRLVAAATLAIALAAASPVKTGTDPVSPDTYTVTMNTDLPAVSEGHTWTLCFLQTISVPFHLPREHHVPLISTLLFHAFVSSCNSFLRPMYRDGMRDAGGISLSLSLSSPSLPSESPCDAGTTSGLHSGSDHRLACRSHRDLSQPFAGPDRRRPLL